MEPVSTPAVAPGSGPLAGVRVVSMAANVPGPVAVARLVAQGATALKVEPPSGDYLAFASRSWYDQLAAGVERRTLDLKTEAGQAALWAALAEADVFVMSQRPSALARLGLAPEVLRARAPRLCVVRIVGGDGAEADTAGHDLTYEAEAGLVQPPALPASIWVDMATGERAAMMACALLVSRGRTGQGGVADVSMAEVARRIAEPRVHGLTVPSGVLGGALPQYALYRTADGWVALAALEPQFLARVAEGLALDEVTAEALAAAFATRSTAAWVAWARERDIPLAAVSSP
jgi:crotonobetainyl-CoA:carnitine CoA-transferase CaiB-like acyl-CoA transferase